MTLTNSFILGIDIGGTHVDIVAVNHAAQIIAFHKQLVSENLHDCILQSINTILDANIDATHCKSIHLGTTLAINSLLELKNLQKVGVLRIAGHYPELPPAFSWPVDKRRAIIAGFETVSGGHEYDNKSIGQLNAPDIRRALQKLIAAGAESIAITGVFSPLYVTDEEHVARIIADSAYKDIPITLSHQVGGLGFIERENNAILNASLKKVLKNHFFDLSVALKKLNFNCDLLITQNNGTLMTLEQAMLFPIRTLSSGPTNSLNGACKLAKLNQAIVIDIGGTSTEIGVVENGFPRYSSLGATIAGIPTNFMLPSIQILALGGGSIIRNQGQKYMIGPDSLGPKLFSESISFNGDHLTLFDVGQILKHSESQHPATLIMQQLMEQLEENVKAIIIDEDVPVLLVGGGSENIPPVFLKDNMLRPAFYQVANAYGAALAEVCGAVDGIHQLADNRQSTIDKLEKQAINQAIEHGADKDSVRIIEKRLLPFYYMENQLTRVIITAAGRKMFE